MITPFKEQQEDNQQFKLGKLAAYKADRALICDDLAIPIVNPLRPELNQLLNQTVQLFASQLLSALDQDIRELEIETEGEDDH